MNKEKLYTKASHDALDNSQTIYDEAKILLDNGRHARGFALSAISLEESAKAFLFRLLSLDLVYEDKTLAYIYIHANKYEQSSQILSFTSELAGMFIELLKIGQEFGHTELKFNVPTDFKQKLEKNIKIIKTPKSFEKIKNNALYVGIDGETIVNPNNSFSKNDVLQILDVAEMQISVVKGLINIDNKNFLEFWKGPLVLLPLLKIEKLLKP